MTGNPHDQRPRISFGSSSSLEQPIIPLRLVAVADLAPEGSSLRGAGGPALRVDKDTFNEVLYRICPRVGFHVRDRYSSTNTYTRIEFSAEDLRSFHPASLVRDVESLRKMLQGRQALVDLRDLKIDREQFLEKLESSPFPFLSSEALSKALRAAEDSGGKPIPAPPPRSVSMPQPREEDTLDAIFDLVEAPADLRQAPVETTPGAARVQQFILEMFASTGAKGLVDRRALDGLIAECDKALSDQMNDVLCNPEFRRLEASWRALKFLVDRTDFREPIQLEVISAGKEQLIRVLNALVEEAGGAEVPVAAVITDFEFANSPPDMDLLKAAAELAEQLQAPLLVNVGAAFFGRGAAAEVSRIPLLQTHLESAEFVKWAAFRQAEASRWVGVGFNRFLLRGRYDESSTGKLPFRFREQGEDLWGSASWAVGSLLSRSFARSGWCGHITGIRGGGAIEDLPVHFYQLPSGEETQISLETIFLRGREDDFFVAGFMVLQSGQDQDKAVLLRAPAAHRPERYPGARETDISRWRAMLTYQLVAARFVHHLDRLLQQLLPLGSPSGIQRGVEQGLRSLMKATDASDSAGLEVRLQDSEDRPGCFDLLVSIRPGPLIWQLPATIELAMPVRKL